MADEVDALADRLYALPLDQFTKARDVEAKRLRATGDRTAADAVKAMRKPSKAAWAVNQVVRTRPEDVDALLGAGDAVRDALARGQDVRPATAAVRDAAQRLVDATVDLAGDATRDDAVTTFRAAAAEPELAARLREARLVAPLIATGFDAADVVVMPRDADADDDAHGREDHADDAGSRRPTDRDFRLERLEAEARRARERAQLLADEAEDVERRAAEARERADDAATRATAAERALDEARRAAD